MIFKANSQVDKYLQVPRSWQPRDFFTARTLEFKHWMMTTIILQTLVKKNGKSILKKMFSTFKMVSKYSAGALHGPESDFYSIYS